MRLVITWPTAIEDKGRVTRYELERRIEGGDWQDIRLRRPLTRGIDDRVRPDRTVQYRVRATNDEGRRSAWALGPLLRPELVDDAALDADAWEGAWSMVSSGGSLAEHVRRSTTRGSRVRFEADDVLAMAVVMTRASTRGRVGIRWHTASTRTIDLGVRPKSLRWVASSKRWGDARTRRVVVTLRSGGSERTEIDGFVVLRAAG